jgi:hypothetical protein
MTPSHPSLSATHVTFDTPTTERLLALGARDVVRASDMLLIGPSRREVTEHARLRRAWWGPQDEAWDRMYAPEVHWQPPVVVWTSPNPADRVNVWRTCCWLREIGLSRSDIFIVDLERAPRGNPAYDPLHCTASVSDHPDGVLLSRLLDARPWSRNRYRGAVHLWRQYVDADLSGFAQTCLRGLTGFPELSTVWFLVSSFFPRRTADGTLHLSQSAGTKAPSPDGTGE